MLNPLLIQKPLYLSHLLDGSDFGGIGDDNSFSAGVPGKGMHSRLCLLFFF
jgi:hypothetical protein